ncbi:MAG: MMPL family transporter, partial [Nocardioidaceae bacterium]
MSLHNPLAGVSLRAARWSATHPWRAILAWLAFVAVAVMLAAMVPQHQTDDADYRVGESGRADAMIQAGGLDQPPTEDVLITPRGSGRLDATAAGAAAREVSTAMRAVPGV